MQSILSPHNHPWTGLAEAGLEDGVHAMPRLSSASAAAAAPGLFCATSAAAPTGLPLPDHADAVLPDDAAAVQLCGAATASPPGGRLPTAAVSPAGAVRGGDLRGLAGPELGGLRLLRNLEPLGGLPPADARLLHQQRCCSWCPILHLVKGDSSGGIGRRGAEQTAAAPQQSTFPICQ